MTVLISTLLEILTVRHFGIRHSGTFHLYITAELEENSTLNSKVWNAAGVRGNSTFPLDHFSYNNSELLDVIFRHVHETNFSGITVRARV